MAAVLKENIPPQADNKTAKKKRTKSGVSTPAPVPATTQASEESKSDHVNGEMSTESAYLKEITKNIRNLKKKIGASAKVDSILAENPGKTPSDLLASRVINADQKAQLDKKPGLIAQLEQYEFQHEQCKKLEEDYQQKLNSEKENLSTSHKQELEKIKADTRTEVVEEHKALFHEKLLTLSRFLRTAAAKRSDEDNQADDNAAFEGALLLVYGGDLSAVQAIEKLIDGAEETVPGVDGEETNFTFKHVRDVSKQHVPISQPEETTEISTDAPKTQEPGTDPTIANAGLTELNDHSLTSTEEPVANGTLPIPEAATVDTGAANQVAESQWDAKLSQSGLSGADGFELVERPRDPAETETGLTATPAAPTGTTSWAEDIPTEPPVIPSAAPADDGFHEVSHHRGNKGRGGHSDWRGSRGGGRGRGDGRGRGGFRGDGRGRGRGGGGGPPRGGGRGRGNADVVAK